MNIVWDYLIPGTEHQHHYHWIGRQLCIIIQHGLRSNLGQVFGITMDGSNNIFVTASSSYGMPNAYNSSTLTGKYGPSGSGAIYKIDAVTGVITTFTVIPQDQTVLVVDDTGPNSALVDKDGIRVGAGLGNICYDADHDQFFVTSFDDGKIYRISSSGTILKALILFHVLDVYLTHHLQTLAIMIKYHH